MDENIAPDADNGIEDEAKQNVDAVIAQDANVTDADDAA